MYDIRRCLQRLFLILGLLVLLSACDQPLSKKATSTPLIPTPTVATTKVSQSCPAPGTARAAVMPAMPVGNHSNLVYLSQVGHSGPSTVELLRYDSITASTTTLLKGTWIFSANISPDGQWALLLSRMQNQAAIQLLRLDGRYFQTLYCAPIDLTPSISPALFSPDQQSLVFAQTTDPKNSRIYLLDVMTGKLHLELSSQQPGYPFGQDAQVAFVPVKWANNSSFYLRTASAAYGEIDLFDVSLGGETNLYLLRDKSKDVFHQQSNVQLLATSTREKKCAVFDVTEDNQQLVCSAFPVGDVGMSDPTALEVRSLLGGILHPIYQGPAGGFVQARAISNTTLLFIQAKIPQGITPLEETIWKINIDGSHPVKLLTSPEQGYWFDFADDWQPWSIVSRDGSLYCVSAAGGVSMMIGSLNGGLAKIFPSPDPTGEGGLTPIGWARL